MTMSGHRRVSERRATVVAAWKPILRGMLIALIALLIGSSSLVVGAGREIRITATQFAYTPPRVRVALGDRVTLRVTSQDVTHGIYIDGYALSAKAYPFREALLSFVADRPGKIRYRCAVICGNLHPFMVGEIIVEPNRPLWNSLGLAILVAAGAVAILWWRREA